METNNQTILQNKTEEIENYRKRAAFYSINDFLAEIKDSANHPPLSTGFTKLDEIFEGGLFNGLYIIGAVSGVGKTTFVLQIADQIAKQGDDVLFFTLEMEEHELIAKSISRLTFLDNYDKKLAKTTRGIMTGSRYLKYNQDEIDLIKNSVAKYGEYSKNLFIIEGKGDIGVKQIEEAIKEHINATGKKPVVIIDYLQILAPFNDKGTDKQNIDYSASQLKIISRDNKIPVIAISSFNRENYKNSVNMASFKESGLIEYSTDFLIGLQYKGQGTPKATTFEIEKASKNETKEIELKVLKNRHGSIETIDFNYNALFNYFEEKVETINKKPR